MALAAATKVSLKLFVDQTEKKVLFAEARTDFVDFLFTILALPLGRVIGLLGANKMTGCLGHIYGSIENLNSTYIQQNRSKDSLLKPRALVSAAQVPLLLPTDALTTTPITAYQCLNMDEDSYCYRYVTDDPRCNCPNCRRPMSSKGHYVAYHSDGDGGGFVKGAVPYMVMDDLVVKPLTTISLTTTMNQFRIKDLESIRLKVELGMEEAMEILRASLQSKTVLTDVLLPKK